MILYLEYSAGRIRGGEVYSANFHSFLCKRFDNVVPGEIPLFPGEIRNPLRHCLYSYKRVKRINPAIIVVNVSSGIRNVLAVWWMKLNRRKVITIILEQRLEFSTKITFFRWIVRRCERYLIKKADIILVISEYTAELARKQKIPVLVHERGTLDDTFLFLDSNIMTQNDSRFCAWENWKDVPLNLQQLQWAKSYVDGRQTGKNINHRHLGTNRIIPCLVFPQGISSHRHRHQAGPFDNAL